jgi:glycosyltransferase involved in cell wall biosynthesis
MNLAILGTRGVPPRYGGFETFAAEIGTRLVKRGHRVTVYSRFGEDSQWNGIDSVVLPYVRGKYFETVTHSLLSAIDAMGRDFDAVLVCNAANAFTLPLLRAARIPAAINVDGIERRRRKWNILGRAFYTIGESFSALFASRVIADADVIAAYYRERFGIEATTIPYGAEFPAEEDTDVLDRLNVTPRGYVLYVSRFEPENNPLEVVRAYAKLHDATPLMMIGDGLYAPDLVAELHRHASDRIRFPGAVYGADYRTLQRNSLLYIQATEVGGTHPALIEAMGAGACVLANDTPENREVGGDAVGYFQLRPVETLSSAIASVLADPDACAMRRRLAAERATTRFRWDAVADAYEKLFLQIS